ncbi:hypothetical protein E2F46_16190 [Luteimonas aestuarii]|uniref:Uncharacterized protein n=1 Tax=Luteimonas aestuarii TaxID=453837 RepID=A0A4R5TII8_9GAMM|nr:hypothetical protein [Luteimonas aestuarii]TDK20340.1 hypothetical protein E2F46_16190 [Luteimonas aestuarii]
MAIRYFISLPDPAAARASGQFAFRSQGAGGMAEELQDALRGEGLFERWRAGQEDPDAVDPALGATDPDARVDGEQRDLRFDLMVTTSLPGSVFKHRMRLLAGSAWELRDVAAA